MNDLIAAALAAAIVAAGDVPEPAGSGAGLTGRWLAEGMPRSYCASDPEGILEVDRAGLRATETSCGFGGRAPAGFEAVSGRMACNAEGEGLVSQVSLKLVGGKAHLSFDGMPATVYRRC